VCKVYIYTIYFIPGGAKFGYIRLFGEHNMDSRQNIDLRLRLLCEIIFALPWSFGGKSRMDKVWSRLVYAGQLIKDYRK